MESHQDVAASISDHPTVKKDNRKLVTLSALIFVVILVIIAIVVGIRSNSDKVVAYLPSNTCPTEVKSANTAVYQGRDVPMSKETYEWVQENCNKVSLERPVVKNLGIAFGKYDEQTGRAGSFIFDKESLVSNSPVNKIMIEFGATEEGKQFPEIVYSQVDADTDILAITDGKIFQIEEQPETNDSTLTVMFNDNWVIHYDHITNIQGNIGDTITAGQVLGKVSLNKDGITGYTEIMIKEGDGRGPATAHCITKFFDTSAAQYYGSQLVDLMNDWETYMEDQTIYNQESQTSIGCVVDSFEV